MTKSYQEINAETIDRWIEEGWEWGQPISHETYLNAKNGNWDVLLTPVNPVPHEWFGNLKDKKILIKRNGKFLEKEYRFLRVDRRGQISLIGKGDSDEVKFTSLEFKVI